MILRSETVRPGAMDHERLWLAVAGLIALIPLLQAGGLPVPPLMCPLKVLSGWPCAGCGTTRALRALAEGSFTTAFRLNPLAAATALAAIGWIGYAITVVFFGVRRLRVTLSEFDHLRARWLIGAGLAANWVFLIADGR
jgi:hypothetical protein